MRPFVRTSLEGFRQSQTQTNLLSQGHLLKSQNFGLKELDRLYMYYLSRENQRQLICTFVFHYAKSRFSHEMALIHVYRITDQPNLP